ncbi:MAG TPA: S1/P1 nuclease, partial [Luteimonas sp.]|nr:S1/P1 nuclease [Luteimonas sp.]
MAFGPLGHRIVGQLAERQLTPTAIAQVKQLLADEPESSLAGVSDWADQLRDTDPDRGKQTARWHYINFPRGDCAYAPARDCPDGNCVIAAINRNFLALADRSRSNAERAEALKFLVHFVADVHQPLHAGYKDDRGGNDFQISYKGAGWNLHSVWDSLIIDRRHLDDATYTATLMKMSPLPPDDTRHSDRPAVMWAQESCRVVQQSDLYPATHILTDAYL